MHIPKHQNGQAHAHPDIQIVLWISYQKKPTGNFNIFVTKNPDQQDVFTSNMVYTIFSSIYWPVLYWFSGNSNGQGLAVLESILLPNFQLI